MDALFRPCVSGLGSLDLLSAVAVHAAWFQPDLGTYNPRMFGGRRLRGLRALQREGWYETIGTGAHVQMRHPERAGKVTVPTHGGRALDIRVVRSIIRQAGLTAEEFEQLL